MPHTPGPWTEDAGFVIAGSGYFVCDPHCQGGPEDHAERDANARLIAAAPELLEMLETIHARSRRHTDGTARFDADYLSDIAALILKATR